MRIGLAQIRSEKGNIEKNITRHCEFICSAVQQGMDLMLFPELSLTGYEPSLAAALAVKQDDERFQVFQDLSDQHNICIGIGAPVKEENGTAIGMILFHPNSQRMLYEKKYLHADELPYFIPGENLPPLNFGTTKIALSICYELSVETHAKTASEGEAGIYLASVAKSAHGMEQAAERLAQICREYKMTALLVNSVGRNDDFESAGNSGVWNRGGNLKAKLDDEEGLLIFDTDTEETIVVNSE